MSAMTRWTPGRNLFAPLFDELFADLPIRFSGETMERGTWMPAVDIHETDEAIRVDAELPGLSKDDVQLSVENGVLTLSGERKFENLENREHFRRVERGYGKFTRSFSLPHAVDRDRVEARFQDGVLRVVLPKAEEAKARRIEIN